MKKILITTFALAILAGCSTQMEEPQTSDIDGIPPIEIDDDMESSENEAETESEMQEQDGPVMEGFSDEDAEWATVKSAVQTENPAANISNFYMPELNGKIYASATANEEFDDFSGAESMTLMIYSYDTETQKVEKIHESEQDTYFRMAGTNGEALLFASLINQDYSPAPCTQVWNNPSTPLYMLNLESPEKMESYQAPKTLLERADTQQSECTENFRK
jgi:hypothetical protein